MCRGQGRPRGANCRCRSRMVRTVLGSRTSRRGERYPFWVNRVAISPSQRQGRVPVLDHRRLSLRGMSLAGPAASDPSPTAEQSPCCSRRWPRARTRPPRRRPNRRHRARPSGGAGRMAAAVCRRTYPASPGTTSCARPSAPVRLAARPASISGPTGANNSIPCSTHNPGSQPSTAVDRLMLRPRSPLSEYLGSRGETLVLGLVAPGPRPRSAGGRPHPWGRRRRQAAGDAHRPASVGFP